jgi:hypothetical protein
VKNIFAMKNAFLITILLASYVVCQAQQPVNCLAMNCFLADASSNDDKTVRLQNTIRKQQIEINMLNEQIISMKSFINTNTNFNALKYSISDALEMQYRNKKVLEYYIDSKAKEAYIIIFNNNNQVVREYPLDLGMKSLLLINQKKLREGTYTYKLFINGVDICSRNL